MSKAFSKKVNVMLTLSLIFSIERYEIHGNMHKCGKTYSKITKFYSTKVYRYDQTNIQLRVSWIFDLIFWTTAIVDSRNVG